MPSPVCEPRLLFFAVLRHAAAVRGEEVESGAIDLLLHLVHAGADLLLARGDFQQTAPQMQDHPVAAEQLVQHIVGLMHKLGQMRGALLIDRLRNEQDVPGAAAADQREQNEQGGSGAAPALREAVFCFSSAFFVSHSCLPQFDIVFRLRQRGVPPETYARQVSRTSVSPPLKSAALVREQRCHAARRCQTGHGYAIVLAERFAVPLDPGQRKAAVFLLDLDGDAADHRQRAAVERRKAALTALDKGAGRFPVSSAPFIVR